MIKTDEAKSLSKKVLQLEERIPTIESQSRMKEYDINRINNELAQKIEENKSLSEKVLQLEDSLPTIKNQLAEAQKELNLRATEVFQKDKKIHTLENQITERDKKFESKASEIEQLQTQMNQLREQLHEAEKLKVKNCAPRRKQRGMFAPFVISGNPVNSSAYSLLSLQGFPVFQHNFVSCPPSHHHLLFRYIHRRSKIRLPKAVSLLRGIS